jgi:sporulation protein YlmC with PRC-barrel domain
MKRTLAVAALLAAFAAPNAALAQSTVGQANDPAAEAGVATQSLNISRDWRTSKLVGSKVTNMQDQSIGAIEDVILDNDGKVVSVLISVGGFLGLGEKRVAVAFKDLLISRAEDGDPVVKVTLSKQSLETAPDIGVIE